MLASDGNSVYHGLQARYERRFAQGVSATASYTWSHLIDDSGQSANRGGCQCQNPRDRGRVERADSLNDVRHRFIAGWVWELPWGTQWKGVPRALLAGWQVGGILTFQSGSPFNVTQSGDTLNNDPNGWTRPNPAPAETSELEERTPARWFNTAAFTRATATHGTAPRNPLTGPGLHNIDVTLSKEFALSYAESHRLLLRAEFFNATNTPQFAIPGGVFGNPTFGVITATSTDMRQIQLALKYTF
jgi:hypothetical protein